MKVEILVKQEKDNPYWLVSTDIVNIPFSHEPAAVAFANALNARLNANHIWPSQMQRSNHSAYSRNT